MVRTIVREDSIRIGIMADSHGDSDSIYVACRLLRERGCDRFFHLGDICDSLHPQTADACIQALLSEKIVAIRGNNDDSLLMNQKDNPDSCLSQQSRLFLENLPSTASFGYADMVHSLTSGQKPGVESLIGPVGSAGGIGVFKALKQPLLFRGHSHSPQVAWHQNGQMLTRKIRSAQSIDLAALMPCIVTCGALADGCCMVWEPSRRTIASIRLAGMSA